MFHCTTAVSTFIRLETETGAALHLTVDHHVFVLRSDAQLEIPSKDAKVGDKLMVLEGKALDAQTIVSTMLVQDQGLFNPYTLEGTIIVDNVAASVHSSSALDALFNALGVSIPTGYQTVLAPIRSIYKFMGATAFQRLEFVIDICAIPMNDPSVLTPIVAASVVAFIGGMAAKKRTW